MGLNGWLNSSALTKPCLDWDTRQLRPEVLSDLTSSWAGLNSLAEDHADYRMARVRRDGHCHEAVMWYVHHLTQDMKQLLSEAQVAIPLLSPARHGFCDTESLDPEAEKICGAYREQVTCASCHSNELPPDHH